MRLHPLFILSRNQVHREASTLVRREREGADALFQLGLATTLLGQNEVRGQLQGRRLALLRLVVVAFPSQCDKNATGNLLTT